MAEGEGFFVGVQEVPDLDGGFFAAGGAEMVGLCLVMGLGVGLRVGRGRGGG